MNAKVNLLSGPCLTEDGDLKNLETQEKKKSNEVQLTVASLPDERNYSRCRCFANNSFPSPPPPPPPPPLSFFFFKKKEKTTCCCWERPQSCETSQGLLSVCLYYYTKKLREAKSESLGRYLLVVLRGREGEELPHNAHTTHTNKSTIQIQKVTPTPQSLVAYW